MSFLIQKLGNEIDINDRYNNNYAKAIADLIIEQQISFKVAISIKKKFNDLISNLSDEEIIKLDDYKLKNIGISRMKVDYIKNVYKYFYDNNIDFKNLNNSKVIDELTTIKGVGSWTAEMFLIFILFRKNIFSKKDIALLNSIKLNYNIENLTDERINNLIDSWAPYNTFASLLLWKSIEENIIFKEKKTSKPWGSIVLLNRKTSDSHFSNINFIGGSGGNFKQYKFMSMLSFHNTKNIILENVNFYKKHLIYNKMMNIVYCENIKLNNVIFDNSKKDSINISISNNVLKI